MNRKLYVGNLSYETTEQELQALFGEAGVNQKTFVDNSCSTDQGASNSGDTTSIDD